MVEFTHDMTLFNLLKLFIVKLKTFKMFETLLSNLLCKAVIWIALLLAAAWLLYTLYIIYLRQKFNRLQIPGPKVEAFYGGHLPLFKRERAKGRIFYEILLDLFHQHGHVVLFWYYHMPFVVCFGQECTKEVLLTLDLPKSDLAYANIKCVYGERAIGDSILTECNASIWRRKRAILNPAFHRKYLSNLMPAFNEICDRFLAKVGRFAKDQLTVDVADLFSRVTLDVIGKVGFNLDINAIEDDNCPFNNAANLCLKGMQESMSDPLWKINFSGRRSQGQAREATRLLRKFGSNVIRERVDAMNAGKESPSDILAHILHMTRSDQSITEEELIDNFLTFFIAGQETTSNNLTFTVYKLCNHPDITHRMVEEIDKVVDDQQNIKFEDLGKLQYLGQVLKESLRLHPPIGGLTRINPKDTVIGGYTIPARTDVILSQFVTHRDPEVWENPDIFDPDRFAPGHADHITGAKYFPFAIGPRNCIGKALAQIESKIILARMYQEFEITLVPGQKFEYEEMIMTRIKGGLLCKVKKRVQ